MFEISKVCTALNNSLAPTSSERLTNWIKQILKECLRTTKKPAPTVQECITQCSLQNSPIFQEEFDCIKSCLDFEQFNETAYHKNTQNHEKFQCKDNSLQIGNTHYTYSELPFGVHPMEAKADEKETVNNDPNYTKYAEISSTEEKLLFFILAALVVFSLMFILTFTLRVQEQYFDFL